MAVNIDFVILWVDGSDPEWQKKRACFRPGAEDNGTAENRFRDWGLLRSWFRGVERFAPWVNRIFFITDGQFPSWLVRDHPKLNLVRHSDYIPGRYLPTFNSNVIELWLHKIPDLGEHFVLFNDDMFLTAPTEPEDFFKNGLPCDSALLDIISASGPEDCLPHMLANNFALINRHFDKKEVIISNTAKFFSPCYGRELVRNFLLFPFRYFSCFRDSHLPASHLKSTYIKVWKEEGGILEQCGANRFRSKSDLTHWLMKCWQICEGRFSVRSIKWGRHFELWEDDISDICAVIERQKYHAVCLNDSCMEIDFRRLRARLSKSFQAILPERSEFEAW